MTPAFRESRGFLSAGRALRFSHRIASARDERECRELLLGAPQQVKLLAVGSGQSLGDSGLNGGHALIVTRAMNKVLEFDRDAGLIRCQPGVSIGELAKHALDAPVDGRRFPFVIPGTDIVTIAGAIANDIHGKNHPLHGSFCHHVEAVTLLRSTGEEIHCSPTSHPNLFRATLGGLGLTGIITSALIRLRPVRGPLLASDDTRFESLNDAFALHSASDAEYRFFWFDPFSEKGRGIFTQSRHIEGEESEAEPIGPLMRVVARLPIPSLMGGSSIWRAWYALMLSKGPSSRSHARTYLDVLAPLGRFKRWNRLLGPRGLLHFQSVVPAADARQVLLGMLADCRAAGELPCIASVKEFGPLPPAGLLSFPREGITSALDFSYRGETTRRLLARLEARVIEAGGAIYPGKDATLSAAGFRRIFPGWEIFAKHVDPRFSSNFWRRVSEQP
jgi:FAD/FMN-containing dehydrogenase